MAVVSFYCEVVSITLDYYIFRMKSSHYEPNILGYLRVTKIVTKYVLMQINA